LDGSKGHVVQAKNLKWEAEATHDPLDIPCKWNSSCLEHVKSTINSLEIQLINLFRGKMFLISEPIEALEVHIHPFCRQSN
jgi:hypothetical protein